MALLSSTESYKKTLSRPELTEDQRRKLLLSQEVLAFAEKELQLNSDGNYTRVAWLNRPYVTWVVSAAEKWSLKGYEWSFPIVGRVPYLGFFTENEAQELEQELKAKNLDTYLRGVSAYSTLGWFNDPLLSSMLRYEERDLVETLIHELVHTTFWVKNSADFNERLASFLGQKGALQFYIKKEGSQSPTTKLILNEAEDENSFSRFITHEVEQLKKWYETLPIDQKKEEIKQQRIAEIQTRFKNSVLPTMKTSAWSNFPNLKLNNARLTLYQTYLRDFTHFEKLWVKTGQNFQSFLKACEPLRKSEDPDSILKNL